MTLDLKKFDKLSNKQWKNKILYRGLHIKYKYQLNQLKKLYPEKIGRLQDRFDLLQPFTLKIDFKDYGKIVEIYGLDFCLNKYLAEMQPIIIEETEFLNDKVQRLIDKYATTLKEIELRDKKLVKRNPKGTIYYIDLTNGNDDRTGLKIGESTIDSTADTTHFVDDLLTGADDYINGSFVWNVTRSAGSLITDFVADTDTVTLADAIPGMTAGDTYYILDAWLTLGKYTTVTSRTAGDIGKVRAGTTQIPVADILFDEDGLNTSFIVIKGCNSSDDPWEDSSDVRPIIDFNDANLQAYFSSDNYWQIENLDFIQSGETTSGAIQIYNGLGYIIKNCRFYDNADIGIDMGVTRRYKIINCEFWSNIDTSLVITDYSARGYIKGCTFNGGAETTNYGIYYNSATPLIAIDCSFGQTTAHDNYDISLRLTSENYLRNCIYNSLNIIADSAHHEEGYIVYSEDDGQVFEAHKCLFYTGTIERETTIVRAGGADTSAKCTPDSVIDPTEPFVMSAVPWGNPFGVFKIWLSADVEKTINMYIRGFGWTGFPTAPQLFIRASYLSNAGTAARTELDSDEVISDNTTWVPFQVTLTPARTGFVYVDVFVGHYEASSGVYVDIKPVIT